MKFLVVGAGPAGALLATLFARRGAEVTLLERQPDFEREFRGEVLMPSGLSMFDQVGLAEELAAVPRRAVDSVEIWTGERRLFELDLHRELGPIGVPHAVSQPGLLEALTGTAGRHPGFGLALGAGVRDLIEEDGRIAGVRTDDAELRADFVFGCDGRFSTLRPRAGLDRERTPQHFDVVWFKLPAPRDLPSRLVFWLGSPQLALVVPTHEERVQLGWVIDKGAYGDLKARSIEEWADTLAGHLSPGWAAHVRENLEQITRPHLLNVVCDHLERWSRPGLLLLGDAAHPMSPVGAQGLNVALRDAVVAANHFEALVGGATPAELDAAAERVRDERLPEIAEIQALQQRGPRLLFEDRWTTRFATRRAAPLLARLGIAQLFAGGLLRRFAAGTADVRYVHG